MQALWKRFTKKQISIIKMVKTIILANEEGKRLRPLTYYIHKSMLPVDERPVIGHILEHLVRHHLDEVVIAVGIKKKQIQNYVGSGNRWKVKVRYSESSKPNNTAGEIARACRLLAGDDFLVYYGDTLTNADLDEFYDFHKKKDAAITIYGTKIIPTETSAISYDEQGNVLEFLKKSDLSDRVRMVSNVPIFFCKKEVLESGNIAVGKDFSKDVIPEFVSKGLVSIYINDNTYHYDVGTLDTYERILEVFEKGMVGVVKKIA